jgi:hypothetical protein
MNYTCPVCGYSLMDAPPLNYEICSCCGTEFGNDDEFTTHAELRSRWIHKGSPWFFGQPPLNWQPWLQLATAGYGEEVPHHYSLSTQTATTTAAWSSEIPGVRFPQFKVILAA